MIRLHGKRLRQTTPLAKGERCVLRLEISRTWGGYLAWLWCDVPGEERIVYSGTAAPALFDGGLEAEQLDEAIHQRLRELLPFILV